MAWLGLGSSFLFHGLLLAVLFCVSFRTAPISEFGMGYVTVDLADFGEGSPGGSGSGGPREEKTETPSNKAARVMQKKIVPNVSRGIPAPALEGGGGEGHGEGNGVGSGAGGKGGGGDGFLSAYVRQVLSRIERNKQYPRLSQQNGEEGVVVVGLQIGRNGELIHYRLLEVPRHPRLIEATKSTLRAAAPFPPLPQYFAQESLSLQVPVRYQLH